MSAKDYKICPALFNAYIAKTSKRDPNLMTADRRKITEQEILMLIDWYLNQQANEGKKGIVFNSDFREGMDIMMFYKKKEEEK